MSRQSTGRRPRGQPTFRGSRFFEVATVYDNLLDFGPFPTDEIGWLGGVIPAAQVSGTNQGTQIGAIIVIPIETLQSILRVGATVSKGRRQLEKDKAELRTQLERQAKQIKELTTARDDALTAEAQARSAFEDAKRDFITVGDLSSSLRTLHSEMKKLHGIQASLERKSQQITQLKQEIKNYKTKHEVVKKQLAQRQTGMKTLRQMERVLHDCGRRRPRRRTPKTTPDESTAKHHDKMLKRRVCYKCRMKGHLAKDCPQVEQHLRSSSDKQVDETSSSHRRVKTNVSTTAHQKLQLGKSNTESGKHPRWCCCRDCVMSKCGEDGSGWTPFPFHKDDASDRRTSEEHGR